MTWRERIAAARKRGDFTQEDFRAWNQGYSCLVGEVVQATWGQYATSLWVQVDNLLDEGLWASFQGKILHAMNNKDFAECERLLECAEDAAFECKRQGITA